MNTKYICKSIENYRGHTLHIYLSHLRGVIILSDPLNQKSGFCHCFNPFDFDNNRTRSHRSREKAGAEVASLLRSYLLPDPRKLMSRYLMGRGEGGVTDA